MDEKLIRSANPDEVLKRLVAPYFAQGAVVVVVGSCCGRLFVGLEAPAKCRVCQGAPEVLKVHLGDELHVADIPPNTVLDNA